MCNNNLICNSTKLLIWCIRVQHHRLDLTRMPPLAHGYAKDNMLRNKSSRTTRGLAERDLTLGVLILLPAM